MFQLTTGVVDLGRELSQAVGLFAAMWPADGVIDTAPLKRHTGSLTVNGLDQCSIAAKKGWLAAFNDIAAIVHTPSRPCMETAIRIAKDETEVLTMARSAIKVPGATTLRTVLSNSNPNLELEIRLNELLNKVRLLRVKPSTNSLLVLVDDSPLARLIAYAIATYTGTTGIDDILDTQLEGAQALIIGNPALIPQFA